MEPTTVETIVQALVGLATIIITTIVAPLLLKQAKVADGKLDDQARQALYPALQYAIAYAQSQLTQDEQGKLESSDKLKNHVTGLATSYVRAKMPDTLEQLGVTDSALQEMLKARLQNALDYLKVPAAK